MLSATTLLMVLILFTAGLVLLARWFEADPKRSVLAESPFIYALALTVYCTSWTFYGAVGAATNSGLRFLTIYLGPTIAIVLWSLTLRKIIRLKKHFPFTSIADFLSSRYGASQGLAALATLTASLAIIPYAALQLESIIWTFKKVTVGGGFLVELLIVVLIVAMSIIVGARRLIPTERNPGLMIILAIFGLLKLISLVVVGSLVTWNLSYGFHHLFVQVQKLAINSSSDMVTWNSYLLLAAVAFLFLPHQFHVGVVECRREKQLATAAWLLPLYFILLTVFVVPIAVAALTHGLPAAEADAFVLTLPLAAGWPDISLLVFLGGFVAGFGMIVMSTVALSTMVANHIVLPIVQWRGELDRFGRHLLLIRWVVIALIVLSGYGFQRLVGHATVLADLGIVAFVGILQFAPAAIGGLYWRQANRQGAIYGLAAGSLCWIYTLIYPMICRALACSPISISLINPEALLGVSTLSPVSHSVFWSLLLNVSFFIICSHLYSPNELEIQRSEIFTGRAASMFSPDIEEKAEINFSSKRDEILNVVNQYLDSSLSVAVVAEAQKESEVVGKDKLTVVQLANFVDAAERRLAGAIGGAAARRAIEGAQLFSEDEQSRLAVAYGNILTKLNIPPGELAKLVDHHSERQAMLQKHVEQLRDEIQQRKIAEGEAKLRQEQLIRAHKMVALGTLVTGIAHEINNPNNYITLNASMLGEVWKELQPLLKETFQDDEDYLIAGMTYSDLCEEVPRLCDGIGEGAAHINRIVTNMRNYVQPSGPSTEETDLVAAIRATVDLVGATIRRATGHFKLDISEELPSVFTSPNDIEVLLVNLVQNACQSLTDRKQSLTILVTQEETSESVTISVSDEGCGISPEILPQIMDPFFTTKRKEGHTGLGLSVCHSIVQSNGGTLVINSEVGKGSTAIVTLPAAHGQSREG